MKNLRLPLKCLIKFDTEVLFVAVVCIFGNYYTNISFSHSYFPSIFSLDFSCGLYGFSTIYLSALNRFRIPTELTYAHIPTPVYTHFWISQSQITHLLYLNFRLPHWIFCSCWSAREGLRPIRDIPYRPTYQLSWSGGLYFMATSLTGRTQAEQGIEGPELGTIAGAKGHLSCSEPVVRWVAHVSDKRGVFGLIPQCRLGSPVHLAVVN